MSPSEMTDPESGSPHESGHDPEHEELQFGVYLTKALELRSIMLNPLLLKAEVEVVEGVFSWLNIVGGFLEIAEGWHEISHAESGTEMAVGVAKTTAGGLNALGGVGKTLQWLGYGVKSVAPALQRAGMVGTFLWAEMKMAELYIAGQTYLWEKAPDIAAGQARDSMMHLPF